MSLQADIWASNGSLSASDNEFLTKPFSEEEVKATVFSMKEDTAPGLDGFSVSFCGSTAQINPAQVF